MSRIFSFLFVLLMSFSVFAQDNAKAFAPSKRAKHRLLSKSGDVLVYSDNFDPNQPTDDMPLALKEMLRAYQMQVQEGSGRYSSRMPGKAIAPLLKSVRHQEDPYNRSCPWIVKGENEKEGPCVSGCVATALEQVVSFWRHPAELKDTLKGWTTDDYTIPDILPGTKIDWDNILVNYLDGKYNDAQAKAIADLTYYLGVAVHMNWGIESSGANLYRAMDPLYDAFDFKTIAYVQRCLYTPQAWNRLLRNELECGRPIVYTGHTYSLGGHCFNIDGVDEDGYYHVNWGQSNYTCYLDLDYLNPYEALNDKTELGRQNGLFNNQTALFMHPDDFEIDIWDTLSVDSALYGVKVDDVKFSRPLDNRGFIRADFSLTNTTSDSLNFTFEVMTYLPSDTAIFMQADYVGLTSVNILPKQHITWPVYCLFSETGDRLFTYSTDDETTPLVIPVSIAKGTAPVYEFDEPELQLIKYRNADGSNDYTARLSFDIRNNATDGVASYLMTYCLFEDGNELDVRHFNFPEVYVGQPYHETVDFNHLKEGQRYTFKLRYPWTIQKELSFVVDPDNCVDSLEDVLDADSNNKLDKKKCAWQDKTFDLSGRMLPSVPFRGVYMRNGRKHFIP